MRISKVIFSLIFHHRLEHLPEILVILDSFINPLCFNKITIHGFFISNSFFNSASVPLNVFLNSTSDVA